MKTLKPVLAILFLILSLTTNAQEKQNDATWEETIGFIEKYKTNLEAIGLAWYNRDNEKQYDDFQIVFSSDHIYFNSLNGKNDFISISLKKLRRCYKANAKWINIKTTGDYIHYKPADKSAADFEVNRISIWISDTEMLPRILNAFKHLTDLSKEQRKAEREASSDKF